MRIKILHVGKNKDKYIDDGVNEFLKRLSPFSKIEFETLKEISPPKTFPKEKCVEKEGEEIIKHLDSLKNTFIVVLDEHGKEFSSVDFSKKLKVLEDEGLSVVFVIGGPFGLSQSVKQKAGLLFALSKMTLTHQMVRPLLLEQIYRAFCISRGREYHH